MTSTGGVAVSETTKPMTGSHEQQNEGQRESRRGRTGVALHVPTKRSWVVSVQAMPVLGTDRQAVMHESLLAR